MWQEKKYLKYLRFLTSQKKRTFRIYSEENYENTYKEKKDIVHECCLMTACKKRLKHLSFLTDLKTQAKKCKYGKIKEEMIHGCFCDVLNKYKLHYLP